MYTMTKIIFASCLGICAAVSRAGVLLAGSEQVSFFAGPAWGVWTGTTANQTDASLTWNHTLVAQIDTTMSNLELAGQFHYVWTIINPGVQRIEFQQHQWEAFASIDPSYSGPVNLSGAASGFYKSVGADMVIGAPYMGFGMSQSSGLVTGGYLQVLPPPTNSPDGTTTPFNASIQFASGILSSGGGRAFIDHIATGDEIVLTPSSGSAFAVGATIDLVIDYPITLHAAPVPEPGTLTTIGALAILTILRRKSIA